MGSKKITAFILVGLSISLAVSCVPDKKTAKMVLDSPSLPVGFKIDLGAKYCRFGWLRFATEYEHDTTLSNEVAVDLLKQCVTPIADTKFLSEAIFRPTIAAADASYRFSTCVASKASKHLTINSVQVGVNTSDWERC